MTDVDRFEGRLEARLRAHVVTCTRSVDPADVARAAIADAERRRSAGLWTRLRRDHGDAALVDRGATRWGRPGLLAVALLMLLLALLAMSAVLVGGRLRERTTAPFEPPLAGTFEATGSLAVARSQHVAVLLQDGRVLVLGGDSAGPLGLPAELYDPITGAFTTVDVDALRRGVNDTDRFSATLLADGRVLLAGGQGPEAGGPPPPRADAVLFDPDSMTVTLTGPMLAARNGHVAVRLADGRVLLAGGLGIEPDGSQRSLASAELYDPATGAFSPTGPMAVARGAWVSSDLTATLLPSGRVLVRGGDMVELEADGSGGAEAVQGPDEIYDPATGRFAPAIAEGFKEAEPSVVLLDGRVHRYDLRTGSAADITPELPETIVEFGPHCRDHEWECRWGWTTTALGDGRVLLAGGYETAILPPGSEKRWTSVVRTAAEVFDPNLGTTEPTGVMVQPREAHTATLLADGRVLVIGGVVARHDVDVEPRVFLASAEIYAPGP